MKRGLIALVTIAVLAVPATAMAHKGPKPEFKNAAKYCKSLRASMGVDAFRQAYGGGKNAFGKCVSQRVHDLRAARKAAIRACATELGVKKHSLRHEGEGQKPNRRDFKRCVAKKSHEATGNDKADFIAAVRTCLTEHDADPATFQDTYGEEGDSAREVFVSCVKEHLQGDDESEPGDDEGGTEPGDDGGDQGEPSSDEPASPSDA